MQNTSQNLFNLLSSKDYEIKTLDHKGKEETNMDEVEMFSFNFKSKGRDYGTVVILLNSDGDMELFFGDTIGKTMDAEAKKQWTDLLYQLRMFSKRNMMGFKLENINRLKYSMQSMASMNESFQNIFESYYGTSKTSYSPQGNAKIIIKHSKTLGENDKRYRNISAIFVENEAGERFKLPFKRIPGAKAMARHVTEGGNPYDMFGLHISEMVNNITTLSGFVRRSKMFEEGDDETTGLVETGKTQYAQMRKDLQRLTTKRGYKQYAENWTPSDIKETDEDVEHIRRLFTREAINSRVSDALPLLARLSATQKDIVLDDIIPEKEEAIPELDEFAQWADGVVDGSTAINEDEHWSIVPDNIDDINALIEWFSEEQPYGINALNVTDALYGLLGDEMLFNQLQNNADKNPEDDARPSVLDWIETFVAENMDAELLRDAIPHFKEQLGLTEDKDLDTDTQCSQKCADDKITNKGKGMDKFKDYTAEEKNAELKQKVTENKDKPLYDVEKDFATLIKRTNMLLQNN